MSLFFVKQDVINKGDIRNYLTDEQCRSMEKEII